MLARSCGLLLLMFSAAVGAEGSGLPSAVERFERGDNAGARQLLLAAQQHAPNDTEVLYYLGRVEHRLGLWSAAVEHLQQAVSLQPTRAEYQFRLGLSLSRFIETVGVMSKPGVARRIRDSLLRATELEPAFIDAHDALLKYDLAAPSFLGGGVAGAREQAAEIARRSAGDGHVANAEIAADQGQPEIAISEYRAALGSPAIEHDARVALGRLYQSLERFGEAFASFDQALHKSPRDMQAQYELGHTAALSGRRTDDGVAALKTYLDYLPNDDDDPPLAAAHLQLGILYEHLKRPDQARGEYRAALALDPGFEAARLALRAMK